MLPEISPKYSASSNGGLKSKSSMNDGGMQDINTEAGIWVGGGTMLIPPERIHKR